MQILSAFLSHKSEDKELVTAVARQLGWRGVRAWLDSQELVAGADLRTCFRKAVTEQNVVVVFVSRAALQSSWVRDELDIALELEREVGRERIIPVFLGDAIELVRSYGPIARQWMDPEHTRVEQAHYGAFVVSTYAKESTKADVRCSLSVMARRRAARESQEMRRAYTGWGRNTARRHQ